MWHVSSRSGVATLRTAIHLLLRLLDVLQQIEAQGIQDRTAVRRLGSLLRGSYPVLKLGADTAVASSHVRLLGVDISLDLSVDRHVSRVCAGCLRYDMIRDAILTYARKPT